jgi:hypothetical protein
MASLYKLFILLRSHFCFDIATSWAILFLIRHGGERIGSTPWLVEGHPLLKGSAMRRAFLPLLAFVAAPVLCPAQGKLLTGLASPILIKGDATTAYRDPLLVRVHGKFMLFYSYVRTDPDQRVYWYTAWSSSTDLTHWTSPYVFTPKSQNLNYSSPGSLTQIGKEWVLALQTIPMNGVLMTDEKVRYPEDASRIWAMRTRDFIHWSKPELLRVKGPSVAQQDMGKMIDPFLLADKDVPGKWWCFFKQNGRVFAATSFDLKTWTFHPDPIVEGENPDVIVDHGDYLLFYSPGNGTGVLRSHDGIRWHQDQAPIVMGQKNWPWAETRITAGFVADMRTVTGVHAYVLVCHSMGPGKARSNQNVLANCNIVIGWSTDLLHWEWPGKRD